MPRPVARIHRRFFKTILTLLLLAALGCGGAFGKAIKRGDELAQRGQWDLAAAEYETALQMKPNDPAARAKLGEMRRRQAIERTNRGRALLGQGDLTGALKLAQEAARFDPQNADAAKLLADVNVRVLDKAEQLLAAHQDREALELTTLVLRGTPGDQRARLLDGKAREKLASKAYDRSEEFAKKGKKANALLELAYCELVMPGFRDVGGRMTKLRQELREEVTFYAVIGRFGGDPRAGDLARQLSPEVLAQGIDEALPLRIVAQAPSSLKPGRGLRLSGTLDGYQLARNQAPTDRSCEYVCGRSTVANKDYDASVKAVSDWRSSLGDTQAEVNREQTTVEKQRRGVEDLQRDLERARLEADRAKLELERCQGQAPGDPSACRGEQRHSDKAQRRLGAARERLAGPQADLDAAQARLADAEQRRDGAKNGLAAEEQRLAGTPRTSDVEMRCTHNYVVTLHSVSAAVTVRIHGEGLADRARLFDGEPLVYNVSKQDETFAAQAGRCSEVTAGDPLQLPAEKDLKHELGTQAVAGVREKIVGAFNQYRQQYLSEARREEAGGVRDDAVESYVRFLLASPGALDAGEKQRIRDFLGKARGLTSAALEQAL